MRHTGTHVHDRHLGRATLAELRVLVVAGVPVGVLVAGVGSRVAMLLLRLTSERSVRGRLSDDGFVIGRVTLGGTYNLLALGAAVGIIGAAAYRLVAPRLVGAQWCRRATVALSCGAVVGSMLVHDTGVDFHVLQPTWLALASFIVLPAAFGWAIGPATDRAMRCPARGRWSWVYPVLLVACFPAVVVVLALLALPVGVLVALGRVEDVNALRSNRGYVFVVRGMWFIVAVAGALALGQDISAIR